MDSYKVLIVLALSSFCMGVTEFVMAGVLLDVQDYFRIDTTLAGYLTTLYALGVVIGAPLVSIPLSRYNRRFQLIVNLLVFALANLVIFLSENFYLTALARFIAGTQHGIFFLIATLTAVQVAKKGKENLALSLMASGLTIALVSGVPLGTFMGNHWGFKSVFLLIFICTFGALVACVCFMPRLESKQTKLKDLKSALKIPALLQSYCVTLCVCGAGIAIYTYVAKLLVEITQISPQNIALILLCYGFFGILGNLLGGKLADRKGAIGALRIVSISQIVIYFSFTFLVYNFYGAILGLCLMGLVGFAGIAPLKMFAMLNAKKYAKVFEDSAISVNEASFNVGIAMASFLGGIVLKYFGVIFTPICAACIVIPALIIVWGKKEI